MNDSVSERTALQQKDSPRKKWIPKRIPYDIFGLIDWTDSPFLLKGKYKHSVPLLFAVYFLFVAFLTVLLLREMLLFCFVFFACLVFCVLLSVVCVVLLCVL